MSIATRLDQAMQEAGIVSQSALARASGIPQPTINRILKGTGKKGPETNTIKALAEACNVAAQWLTDGTGPMRRQATLVDEADVELDVSVLDDTESDFVRIAVVKSFLHAGLDGIDGDFEPDDDADLVIPRSWLVEKGLSPRSVKALRIKGMSMYPTLRPGAIAFVNLADRTPLDGQLFAVNVGDKSVVKRLEYEGGIWHLASDNTAPEFKRRPIRDNDIQIAGRVAWAISSFL